MKYIISLWVIAFCIVPVTNYAQNTNNDSLPNSTENNNEDTNLPVKVLHAEPLYIDLIRDLGARKGEKEWNLGLGLTDNNDYDEYIALIEYEWAPIDRLGFEIELPFSLYYPTTMHPRRQTN